MCPKWSKRVWVDVRALSAATGRFVVSKTADHAGRVRATTDLESVGADAHLWVSSQTHRMASGHDPFTTGSRTTTPVLATWVTLIRKCSARPATGDFEQAARRHRRPNCPDSGCDTILVFGNQFANIVRTYVQ